MTSTSSGTSSDTGGSSSPTTPFCSAALPRAPSRPRTDVLHGASADTFQVLAVLGKGAFGTVYKVADKQTGRSYAMKVLQKERIFEKENLRLSITEKNVQSSLAHPFIVALACAFQTDHELVIVMQYCPCGTLLELVRAQGGLPEELSRLYFSEMFLAVEHIHSRDVAYRDLKCDNVVIDDLGHAMLTDFGLCKEKLVGLKRTDSFVGTPRWMCPEILALRCHGKEVDVYGLGVLLFEMLTCHPPFYTRTREARNRQEVIYHILNAELELPSFVSGDCSSILGGLLEKDPELRLGAADTTDIRGHPFLAPIDLGAVLRREVPVIGLTPRQSAAPELGDAAKRADQLKPFQSWPTLSSLLGGSFVQGWEFPALESKIVRDIHTPTSVTAPPSQGWRTQDLLPLSQMYVLF